MKNFLLGILFTAVVLLGGGYLILKMGFVSFQADQEPGAFESRMAMSAVDASTDRHAPDQKNPLPPSEENVVTGAQVYVNHCAGCHGTPSNPESEFSKSFYPPAPGFFRDAPDMSENENFYLIQHGIRWTGMPAWNKTLNDTQIWQVVTFLSSIEKLPPAASKVFEPPAPAAAPPAKK